MRRAGRRADVTNLAQADAMIRRLGALGCRLALDDFGTGANSLTNLKSLQIARVKIDGSFVRDIVTDKRSQATAFGKPEPLDEVLTHLSQDESRRLHRLFLEL
jgi:EAL domain-containing protein (putative c-di-GMP-specific phosphodiesterase class I)